MVTETLAPGYKSTEIGAIPEGWNVTQLYLISSNIGDGIHTTPKYVTSSDIYFVNGNNLDNRKIIVTENTKFTNEEEYKKYKIDLTEQTILMSINGTIGNLAFFENEKIVLGKSAAYINLKRDVNKYFIFYMLQTPLVLKYYENELTGTTIRNLSLKSIRETPILLPKEKEEQSAIAQVLSNTDSLIESLEKLIEKKKNIKQGTMQQLLTGKKRLPGFHGDWEVKNLGDIAEIKKGQLITKKICVSGNIPVIAGGKTAAYYHNKSNRHAKTITVSASGAYAGYVSFHETPIFASDCSTIEENDNYSIEFIYYQLQRIQDSIYKMQTGGAQPHIHPRDLKPLEFLIPSKEEQSAIAQVLSDMDAEIEKLEQKRDKYKGLKIGMMQQLLPGRIRLKC